MRWWQQRCTITRYSSLYFHHHLQSSSVFVWSWVGLLKVCNFFFVFFIYHYCQNHFFFLQFAQKHSTLDCHTFFQKFITSIKCAFCVYELKYMTLLKKSNLSVNRDLLHDLLVYPFGFLAVADLTDWNVHYYCKILRNDKSFKMFSYFFAGFSSIMSVSLC